jgi:hypothetical protein
MTGGCLSCDDEARLATWAAEIAETLLPLGAARQDRGSDWRFTHAGGLSIAKRSGAWFSHALGAGAYSAVSLIELLRQCARAEAEQWAVAWLAGNPGTGSCDGSDDAADSQAARLANAFRAREIIAASVSAGDSVAETYLRSRGLNPPYPGCVRFLPNARIGESALVGLLTANDTVVGAQLTYLDPCGRKTLRGPARQTFVLDHERAKGAVFMVEKLSANATLLLVEGLEDGLALLASGRPEAVFGLPGVGGLQHFPARRGQAIVVMRDGDADGSPADRALLKGVDHLLLHGAAVKVTPTPRQQDGQPKPDANRIFLTEGADALNALVDAAAPAELSRDGQVQRLARLKPEDYDPERRAIADKFDLRLPTLDGMVAAARPRKRKDGEDRKDLGLVEREPDPWPEPVQLREVLDTLRERLNKHIIFGSSLVAGSSKAPSTVVTLWSAHTYVHTRFEYSPRLPAESAQPRCGKTSLHDLLKLVVFRPVDADRLTAASLVRLKSAVGPVTVLLDELPDALRTTPELDAVLRSGFQRNKRYINMRPLPEGGFEHETHDVYLPVSVSMIGAVRGALADRSVHVLLRRKNSKTKVAKLRHGKNRQVLLDCGRKLARWAEDETDNLDDDPSIPEQLNDRQADFSVPLLAIADQAGGDWPQDARDALVELLVDSSDLAEDDKILLLHDLRTIFDMELAKQKLVQPDLQPKDQEIQSKHLVSRLLTMQESPWEHLENGRPLTQHKLAGMLRGFGIRPGNIGSENDRQRGYRRLQFTEAWEAYTGAPVHISLLNPSNQSAQTAQNGRTPPVSGQFQSAQEGSAVHSENASKTAEIRQAVQSVHSETGIPGEKIKKPPSEPRSAAASHNHGGKDFSLHNAAETPSEEASGVPLNGNGGARTRPTNIVADLIREIAASHPDWSEERLSKQSGQPLAVVKRALTNRPRPASGGIAGAS